MTRSDLHKKVWSTPMATLAKELGISDVGLAKACRRHSVPVPPRGYWAKLKAGQSPRKAPLPAPELDVVVHFATTDPEKRARQAPIAAQRAQQAAAHAEMIDKLPPIQFADDLEDAHPLVKAVQKYCERLPKLVEKAKRDQGRGWSAPEPEDRLPPEQHGRYHFLYRGLLDINASLSAMEWVLRFHATLLGAWVAGGMMISRKEQTEDRRHSQSQGPVVEMRLHGESLTFKFSEGYRRDRLTPSEWAAKKKEYSYASEYEIHPSGKFTFTIQGTEYPLSKTWQDTQAKLQEQVSDIVQTAFQFALTQPAVRKEREAREAEARHAEAVRATRRRRREAQAAQLGKAFELMEAEMRVRRLQDYLDQVAERIPTFRPPFDERMKGWIEVVRAQLRDRNPVDEMMVEALTISSWETWPPDWWPTDQATPGDLDNDPVDEEDAV